MKRGSGTALVVLGLLSVFATCASARQAPNLSYLIGQYLFGIALRQSKKTFTGDDAKCQQATAHAAIRANAELGIIGGIVLMLIGSGVSQQGRDLFPLGLGTFLLLLR